jgi:hypothetical protein
LSLNKKIGGAIVAGALSLTLGLGLMASTALAAGPMAKDVSGYAGVWHMNASLTKMGRFGPNGKNIVRGSNFTWVFSPIKGGLKMEVFYDYPQAKPNRTMALIPDEKAQPCDSGGQPCLTTGGNPKEQTYRYYSINPHMLARVFYNKDEIVEDSTYSLSTDGKRLTIISWDPATPEWQNIQVFDKQP